jgi:hypothetical protein
MELANDDEYQVKEHVVGMVHGKKSHSKRKNPDYILNMLGNIGLKLLVLYLRKMH